MAIMNPERIRQEGETPPIPMVESALLYAQQGWPVFPLAGKIPYDGTHGCYARHPRRPPSGR